MLRQLLSQYSLFSHVCFSLLLFGCGSADDTTNMDDDKTAPITQGDWYRPAIQLSWQWQLIGPINTNYAVQLYDIDLFDTTAQQIKAIQQTGAAVICYFSAGSYENWRSDVTDIPASALGRTLDGWEDERWFDIRHAAVKTLMLSRMQLAKQKGCDGVEPDNVDGYTNTTGFNLTANDQLTFNRYLANTAHSLNLSVGLKNDVDQIEELVSYFDFAVNEQCFEYDECETMVPFVRAGKPVLNAEYAERYVDNIAERNTLCEKANDNRFSTLILPLDLDDTFRYSC